MLVFHHRGVVTFRGSPNVTNTQKNRLFPHLPIKLLFYKQENDPLLHPDGCEEETVQLGLAFFV